MKRIPLSVFTIMLFTNFASAGFDDLKAPIENNSCRLANAYTKDGQDYSGSAGVTSNGKYNTAIDKATCLKKCEREEESRVSEKPEMYGLKIACYYGKEQLYKRIHK